MSNKNDDDLEENLDQNPADDPSLLTAVDKLIAEEDPDFFKSIEDINIDSEKISSAVLAGTSINQSSASIQIRYYIKKPFEFKSNLKQVLAFWGILFFSIVVIYFVWINNKNLLHQELFMTSLQKIGTPAVVYNPNTEVEAFYDNPRFIKNLISLSPLHLNLKASENSGNNPMLALEIVIEGLSTDAIIEIKDRQAEFKDLVARLTEEKTYDDLVTVEGKRNLCDKIRDLLNSNLTRGQVRRVLLKTFIIKS